MNVLIYGSGAVGTGLAVFLIKSGQSVDLLAREETARALNESGLRMSGIFGEFSAPPESFRVLSTLSGLDAERYDFILVCTKSNDTLSAGKELSGKKELLKARGKIVHFQNGWGNAEKLLGYFDKEQIYTARVITGFTRPALHEVKITVHAQPVHIGSLFGSSPDAVKDLAAAIALGGLPCEVTEDIAKDLWAKMLYNCALNPLGAILRVPYGFLGERLQTRQIMDRIFDEIYNLFEITGHETHWSSAPEYREVFYSKLLPSTYGHESSMLQDLIQDKETEIDALNGAVVTMGDNHQLDLPYNRFCLQLIKTLEGSSADTRSGS